MASSAAQVGVDLYKDIKIRKNENEDQIVCDVCLDEDDEDENEILICELCLVAVHQTCYGSELSKSVPKGDWFCARCRDLKANPLKKCQEIKCKYCPKI